MTNKHNSNRLGIRPEGLAKKGGGKKKRRSPSPRRVKAEKKIQNYVRRRKSPKKKGGGKKKRRSPSPRRVKAEKKIQNYIRRRKSPIKKGGGKKKRRSPSSKESKTMMQGRGKWQRIVINAVKAKKDPSSLPDIKKWITKNHDYKTSSWENWPKT